MTKKQAWEMINDYSNFADNLENYTDLNNARKMAMDALLDKNTEDQTKKIC